jgi:hypothetical protein
MKRWISKLFTLFKGRCEVIPSPRVAWNGRPLAEGAAGIPGASDYSTLTLEPAVGDKKEARGSGVDSG